MVWITLETSQTFNKPRKQERLYFNTKEEAENYAKQQQKHSRRHIEIMEVHHEDHT